MGGPRARRSRLCLLLSFPSGSLSWRAGSLSWRRSLCLVVAGVGLAAPAAGPAAPSPETAAPDPEPVVAPVGPDPPEIRALPGYRSGYSPAEGFGADAYVFEAGEEGAPWVVLVHGISRQGAHDWNALVPELVPRFRVLAFDLPRFGRSPGGPGDYSPTNYAAFVLDQIDRRVEGPFHLVAHSMGVSVALEVARQRPDRVGRLLLADAAGILHGQALSLEELDRRRDDLGLLGRMLAPLQEGAFDLMGRVDDRVLYRFAGLLDSDATAVVAARLMAHDSGPALDGVGSPALVVWGEKDEVASRRGLFALAARLRDARIAWIPGAAHVPMREAPEAFNTLALGWLSGEAEVGRALAPAQVPSTREGRCRGERGVVFEGAYRRIRLERCREVVLRGVRARSLQIESSTVRAEDLVVSNEGVAVSAYGSRLQVSGGAFVGEVGLVLRGSEVDLAGVRLEGQRASLETSGDAKLLCSLCRLESPVQKGRLHGFRAMGIHTSM